MIRALKPSGNEFAGVDPVVSPFKYYFGFAGGHGFYNVVFLFLFLLFADR